MQPTIIDREIRRCRRNLLLVNLGVVAALIWWLVVEQRYLYNCVAGPFHIAATALVSDYGSSSRHEFFAVDDTLDATDTGVYISHTNNGAETSKDYFLAAPVGDRLLLIKSGSGTPAKHYQGELTSVPVDIRQLIEEALRKQRSLAFGQTFYPFMLDSTSYRFNAYLAIGFGLPIFALCAYNLKKAFVRFEDVQRSPTFQATRRYGSGRQQHRCSH